MLVSEAYNLFMFSCALVNVQLLNFCVLVFLYMLQKNGCSFADQEDSEEASQEVQEAPEWQEDISEGIYLLLLRYVVWTSVLFLLYACLDNASMEP